MSDTEARQAMRDWEAERTKAAHERATLAYRRAGLELPWELVASSQRWTRVVSFVAKWFERPLEESDGTPWEAIRAEETRLGHPLPEALGEIFRLLGERPGVVHGEAEPIALEYMEVEDGELVICQTHQGSAGWLIREQDLAEADPTVYYFLDAPEPLCPVSDFYLSLLLYQVGQVYDPPEGLRGTVQRWIRYDRDDMVERVRANYARVPIPSLWAGTYGDADTIVIDDGYEVLSFACRTDAAWEHVRSRLGDEGWVPDDYGR